MTTLVDLRTIIARDKLQDPGGEKWDPDTITTALVEAIRDYSHYFPRKRYAAIAHVDGQKAYELPADLVRLGYLADALRSTFNEVPPDEFEAISAEDDLYPALSLTSAFFSTGYDYQYCLWGSTLRITPAPATDLRLYYLAYHSCAVSAVLSVPFEDEDLLILYAWASCIARDAGADAILQRWDEGSGRRDDNPVLLQSTRLFNAYREKVRERLAIRTGGRIL